MQMVELTEAAGVAGESPPVDGGDETAMEEALEEAIKELSAEQREVVELRRKGVSFKEIAEKQKTNLNTALCRMHYAVNNLRSKLRRFLE